MSSLQVKQVLYRLQCSLFAGLGVVHGELGNGRWRLGKLQGSLGHEETKHRNQQRLHLVRLTDNLVSASQLKWLRQRHLQLRV